MPDESLAKEQQFENWTQIPSALPQKVMVPTVDSKPAVGVFSGAVTTLGLSLANRYTAYQPTVEEAGAILVILSGLAMWLVPPTILKKLNKES